MRIMHVTIMTGCMDTSVEFYQNVVALTIQRDMRDNPEHQIVFLANGEGETCVELVANPKGAYAGNGISMGFGTEDAEAYREKLQQMGLKPGEMISPNPHTKFFFVKDPNGVDIQFVQEG